MSDILRNLGKQRRIQQLATTKGHFALCAMDHRGSMRQMLRPGAPQEVSGEELVEFKMDLCDALARESSGVLLDPEYGAPHAVAKSMLPPSVGLLVSLEATDYEGGKYNRRAQILEGWGPDKVARMGATGAKLLVHYRPDIEPAAQEQRSIVASMVKGCSDNGIPLVLEAVAYLTEEEEKDPQKYYLRRPDLVIESARQLRRLGPDILKMEFPLAPQLPWDAEAALRACRELDKAADGPWVLLSQGAPFDLFEKQVEVACQAGASGFLGGRAVWQEAVEMPRPQRQEFLRKVGRDRMRSLGEIVSQHACPWWEKVQPRPSSFSEDWYK